MVAGDFVEVYTDTGEQMLLGYNFHHCNMQSNCISLGREICLERLQATLCVQSAPLGICNFPIARINFISI